ncbi:MAG: acetylglutamate kinase [Endomicrobiales bacterium]
MREKKMKPVTVVKFGGSLGRNEKAKKKFLGDLASLAKKESVVLVHGGGPEINSWLTRLGIESRFVGGLRYTDEQTLEVVEMVLSGKVNRELVSQLNRRGVRAVGISGKDGQMAYCRRVKPLGFVGEPVKVNTLLLKALLRSRCLPVVSSLGFGGQGQTLNLNADSLAMAIAAAMKAKRLILLTDVCGVLDENKRTIPVIPVGHVPSLIKKGIVTGGMIPKVKACAKSIKYGIKEVWIADGCSGLKKVRGTVICK